jgi:tetratricopeptide (TPR) repeat protein
VPGLELAKGAKHDKNVSKDRNVAYHAFVVMPFGVKEGIDFNRVYGEYVKPALEGAHFEVFRADEELEAGDIRTDLFQELLLADLVVADLSIDNPNVWYELGVRHALRMRGVIGIRCRREKMPFDVYSDRSLKYHIRESPPDNAYPDPAHLEKDKAALARFAMETLASWYDRKVSPVYHLLPYLKEPDWTSLRIAEAKQFWEEYEAWNDRIEIARRGERAGDILVLADEAPTRVFRVEGHRTAGRALMVLGQFGLALAQFEAALAIRPRDIESRRQKGVVLGRLQKHDSAKEWVQDFVRDYPEDAEGWALLGRVEKDAWVGAWRAEHKSVDDMLSDAGAEDGVLREAIHAYTTGYKKNPSHYYSGINALTLSHLLAHVSGDDAGAGKRAIIEGGVRWALTAAMDKDSKDYWARASLAELEVLAHTKSEVESAYKSALAVADKDWFKLNSSLQQLLLFKDLGFRPVEVGAAIHLLQRAVDRVSPSKLKSSPRQVFLFSGHMIDAQGRTEPRFPARKEKIAADAIAAKLDELGAGPEDLALCGGACGGDLLFAEACLARGLSLELRIPFDEPTFIQRSVAFARGNWTDRFYQAKDNPRTKLFIMPKELGPVPKGANPYARDNLWQLYSALAWGPDKVRFIGLWDGKGGDGAGGTQHMYDSVQKYAGRVYVLDTTSLW